jgi:hypothetical protein
MIVPGKQSCLPGTNDDSTVKDSVTIERINALRTVRGLSHGETFR